MEPLEFLLKVVTPIGVAIFIFLKKREIKKILSNFGSNSSSSSKYETSPEMINEKLDAILRHYNE